MKLKKYENKELRKSKIISLILACVCIISIGTIIYQSYANYQMKATFKIINGKLKMSSGSGDIEFAFYNGDQKLDDIPLKESGVLYIGSRCTNDAIIKWDSENWVPSVYNLKKTKTNCSLYFGSKGNNACILYPESAACKYGVAGETAELLYDDTEDKNLRFVGSDPKNYVLFNCEEGIEPSKETCETWRIIGIMNNIEDEDGNSESHLKIIRDKFDTKYSWDSSASGVNNGGGVNEWSEANIEKVLNDEYLYRRTGSNLCYTGSNNTTGTCPDWTNIGIRDTAREMIASVKWHTGTMPVSYSSSLITAKYMYEAERSNHTGKERCSGGDDCNDDVDRMTTWIGRVGLMYPSDYGYAVGTEVRETCLGKSMQSYNSDNCMTYDWLRDANNKQWTMIPVPYSLRADLVFVVHSGGHVYNENASTANAVRPTQYLKSDVKIVDRDYSDYGSSTHPFELEYN